jgi:hypothetical protein
MTTSKSKTLMLSSPVDMYFKLCWEYSQLQKTLQTDEPRTHAYRVLNATITALHMKDWIGKAFLPRHYAALQKNGLAIPSKKELEGFAMSHPGFRMCESVANAAKHFHIRARSFEVETYSKQLGGPAVDLPEFSVPMVGDGESYMPIYMAVGGAIEMWRRVLLASGFAAAEELIDRPLTK